MAVPNVLPCNGGVKAKATDLCRDGLKYQGMKEWDRFGDEVVRSGGEVLSQSCPAVSLSRAIGDLLSPTAPPRYFPVFSLGDFFLFD